MSSMVFEQPGGDRLRSGVARWLRWGAGAAALAVAVTGCGGGNDQTLGSEAQAQRDQAGAVMQAQQSVSQLMSAVIQPGSGTENFEAGMGDWQNWGNAQVVAGAGVSGSKALQVGAGSGGAALRVPDVVGGTTYRLTAQVRVTDPVGGPATLGVDFYNAAGARIIGTRALPNVTNTSYAPFTYDVQAPAGTAYALVWVWKNGSTGFAYVDDVAFGAASAPPPPPPTPPEGNLLSNGGFESGMAGWVDWGNTRIVSDPVSSGASALSVGPAAGGAGHSVGGVVPGTTYRLVARARVSDASEKVFVGVNFLDSGGTLIGSTQLSTRSTSYTTLTGDVTAPAGAVRAVVYVWKDAGSGTATVDDFAFGVASGSTPPPPTGANLLVNGTFENGLASWVNWGNATTSSQAAAGTSAAQIGTGAGGLGQRVTGIVPGNTYRVMAQVKVSSAGETGYLGLKFMDAGGNPLEDALVPFSSTAYASAQVELVAPPNATTALVYVWKNAGSGFALLDEAELRGAGAPSPGLLQPGEFAAFSPVDLAPNFDGSSHGVISAARLVSGGSVVAWFTGGAVVVQRLDAAGNLVGAPQRVADAAANSVSAAALADGGWLVAWVSPDRTLLFRRFDASGASVAGPLPIDATAFAAVTGIHATGLPDGGFVAAWVGAEGSNPKHAFLRRFGPTGAALTHRAVLGDSAGAQTSAQVTPVPDGSFVAAWVQANPDGTDTLFARRLDAGLQPAGADLVLQPPAPAHPYNFVAAASRAQGAVLAAWGYNDGPNVQARWQLLDLSGPTILPIGTPGSSDTITANRLIDSVEAIPSSTGFRVVAESTFGFSRGTIAYTTMVDVGLAGERLASTETSRYLASYSATAPVGCLGGVTGPGVAAAGGEDGHYLLAYATCPAATGYVKPSLQAVGH